MSEQIVKVRIVWTYETEVLRRYVEEPGQMTDIAAEAFTQGDGDLTFETKGNADG